MTDSASSDKPKRGRPASHSAEEIAKILVLAIEVGETGACEAFRVTPGQIKRFRERLERDVDLQEAFARHFAPAKQRFEEGKTRAAEMISEDKLVEWHTLLEVFLSKGVAEMINRLPTAELRDIAHSVQIVGDLRNSMLVLSEYQGDSEGEEPAGSAGKTAGGEEGSRPRLPH